MLTQFLYAIAWPGAGRSLASPWLVYGIALAVTVPFTVWLLHGTRRKPPTSSGPPAESIRSSSEIAMGRRPDGGVGADAFSRPRHPEHDLLGALDRELPGVEAPHVTYDTYFGKGPAAGSAGAPNYPIDTGLTMGSCPRASCRRKSGSMPCFPPTIRST